jgi:hypothetical protein
VKVSAVSLPRESPMIDVPLRFASITLSAKSGGKPAFLT